jgi:hypothetical protein
MTEQNPVPQGGHVFSEREGGVAVSFKLEIRRDGDRAEVYLQSEHGEEPVWLMTVAWAILTDHMTTFRVLAKEIAASIAAEKFNIKPSRVTITTT